MATLRTAIHLLLTYLLTYFCFKSTKPKADQPAYLERSAPLQHWRDLLYTSTPVQISPAASIQYSFTSYRAASETICPRRSPDGVCGRIRSLHSSGGLQSSCTACSLWRSWPRRCTPSPQLGQTDGRTDSGGDTRNQ